MDSWLLVLSINKWIAGWLAGRIDIYIPYMMAGRIDIYMN